MRLRDLARLSLSVLSVLMLSAFLFPIYWMVITALKPQRAIFANPPEFIPRNIDWSVWGNIFISNPDVPRYFLNSAIVGIGTTLLTLALAAPAAYGIAHLPIRGKGLIILVSLSSLMFPVVMLATPLFVIFSRLGLTDSYIGLILANTALALPFALVVLRPFFLTLPLQLTEAARIDGCTAWGAFARIMLPLASPGLITAAIFTFLFGWNDLVFALTLTNTDQFRPVTAGLWTFIGVNNTDWNSVMAFSTLAMLPPLAVFLTAQRYVVAGLTSGAVKQ
ncbi:MAG: carbohydrate ABC transporter permease [Deinococcota bacterium]